MDRLRTPRPPSWGSEHAVLAKAAARAGWAAKPRGETQSLPAAEQSRGIFEDDQWGTHAQIGPWKEKYDPYGMVLGDGHLRMLSRFFIPAAVNETLLTELAEHGQRQQSPYGRGYQVRLREARRPPTRAEQKKIDEISSEIDTCGVLANEEERFYRPSFRQFLRQIGTDSLVLDRYLVEVIPDRTGKPARFLALDAGRARFAIDEETGYRYPVMLGRMGMRPVAEWRPGDPHRAFIGVRNVSTVLEHNGYGTSELEMAVAVIYAMAKAVEHSVRYLDHGLTGAGVLALHDKTDRKLVGSLRNYLAATMMGAQNTGRVALLSAPDGKAPTWIPFNGAKLKDMEFATFFNLFLKVYCALCKIDPVMVNFQFGNEGQKAALVQGGGKDRLDYGRMKGVWSLARNLIGSIDRYYVRPKYPEFEIVAAGLDSESEEERNARDKEALEWLGVNEIRARRDEKPIDLEQVTNLADVPGSLKQQWLQLQMQKLQAQGAEPEQDDEPGGAPAGPGGGRPDPQDDGDTDEIDLGRLFEQASSEEDEPTRKSLMAALEDSLRRGATIELREAA
jgi:hypothetical protein